MSAIKTVRDLTAKERAQFDKTLIEGDSGTSEWEELMLLVTLGSNGNGEAFERRQAVRRLYAVEMAKATTGVTI